MIDTLATRECVNPECDEWMEQTSGHIINGVSHGDSWKCPRCHTTYDEPWEQYSDGSWKLNAKRSKAGT